VHTRCLLKICKLLPSVYYCLFRTMSVPCPYEGHFSAVFIRRDTEMVWCGYCFRVPEQSNYPLYVYIYNNREVLFKKIHTWQSKIVSGLMQHVLKAQIMPLFMIFQNVNGYLNKTFVHWLFTQTRT
jgi:hypothetical protein